VTFLERVLRMVLTGALMVTSQISASPRPSFRSPSPPPAAAVGSLGHDISWPNCPVGSGIPERRTLGLPLPAPSSRFVVIGLTNGPGFYANPCLGDQVAFARRRHLWTAAYAVVTYPTEDQLRELGSAGPRAGDDLAGRLFNTGWAQARFNLGSMQAAGLTTPILWLDVEPVRPPAPWSADVAANRVVLEGSMAAYRQAGLRLGVYSTPYLWRTVVGDVDYGLPEWRAAGATSMARALEVCAGEAIQGGVPVLGQWLDGVDKNVLCPGRPARTVLRSYFTPY
jgi:hypothetical protein